MFQRLFRRAERSLDQAVSRIVDRVIVAIPLLVAAGFGSAALTVKLVEVYDATTAYALMAALFAAIGLVTMLIVGIGTRNGAPAEAPAAEPEKAAETAATGEEPPADIADLLTPELRALLVSAAPVAVPGLLRGLGRNLPLIFVLALVGFVISRFVEGSSTDDTAEPAADDDTAEPDPAVAAAAAGASAAAAA